MSAFIALYQERLIHTYTHSKDILVFTVDEGAEIRRSIRQQNRRRREKNGQFNWGAQMHLSYVTFQSREKKKMMKRRGQRMSLLVVLFFPFAQREWQRAETWWDVSLKSYFAVFCH